MNITRKFNIFALYLPLALLLAPDQAWALQAHAPPEGIYVHQLAHLFFAAALSYLFWDVRRSAFPGKGWRYLQIFCVLMILWNILAFSGHWLGFHIDSSDIIRALRIFFVTDFRSHYQYQSHLLLCHLGPPAQRAGTHFPLSLHAFTLSQHR